LNPPRSSKLISKTTNTGTGVPWRVPGVNRQRLMVRSASAASRPFRFGERRTRVGPSLTAGSSRRERIASGISSVKLERPLMTLTPLYSCRGVRRARTEPSPFECRSFRPTASSTQPGTPSRLVTDRRHVQTTAGVFMASTGAEPCPMRRVVRCPMLRLLHGRDEGAPDRLAVMSG
jgi:hypothetical protein